MALDQRFRLTEASNCLRDAEKIAKDRASMEGVSRAERDEWAIKINMALAR